jgi:PTS system nitrogen regulatory IIA component
MHLKVRDAAELLGISTKAIHRWIEDKKIPFHRIGDQYRFDRAELFEFSVQQRLCPSPRLLPDIEAPEPATAADCLDSGGIYYHVGGGTKRDVLENALNMMVLHRETREKIPGSLRAIESNLADEAHLPTTG